MTLNEYVDINLADMDQYLENVEIIKSEDVMIGGVKGYEIVYSAMQGEETLKWRQLVVVYDNKAYLLTYIAKANTYGSFQEEVDTVINSFEIIA